MANRLLIHFCGTAEDTERHYRRFIAQLDATHFILISGLGADTQELSVGDTRKLSVLKNETEHTFEEVDITCTNSGKCKIWGPNNVVAKNSMWYQLKSDNDKMVFLIEKKTPGINQASGYHKSSLEKVRGYTSTLIRELKLTDLEFDTITITGHSRGAAAALPSFLSSNFYGGDGQLKAKKLNFVFLDPVAGQTGNTYPMGDKWTTVNLYKDWLKTAKDLFTHITDLHITEIFARSAKFAPLPGLDNFNTARRFLYPHDGIPLERYQLGFSHSGMITRGQNEEFNEYYEKGKTPFWTLIRYLNQLINGTNTVSADGWHDEFLAIDKAAIEEMLEKYHAGNANAGEDFGTIASHYMERSGGFEFDNLEKKKVSLDDLLGESRNGKVITDLIQGESAKNVMKNLEAMGM